MFARLQADLFEELAPATGIAVDVGCGTGELLRRALRSRPQLTLVGMDLSGGMLSEAKSRAPANAHLLVQGSVERIPLATGTSRLTTCFGTLLFADSAKGLSELTRITHRSGWVLFDLPGPWNLATRASLRSHQQNSIELPPLKRLGQYRRRIESHNLLIESIVPLGASDQWKGVPLLWRSALLQRAMHTPRPPAGGPDLDLVASRLPGLRLLAARWIFVCRVRE